MTPKQAAKVAASVSRRIGRSASKLTLDSRGSSDQINFALVLVSDRAPVGSALGSSNFLKADRAFAIDLSFASPWERASVNAVRAVDAFRFSRELSRALSPEIVWG